MTLERIEKKNARGEGPRKNRNSIQMGLIQKQNNSPLTLPSAALPLPMLAPFLGRLSPCGTHGSSSRLTFYSTDLANLGEQELLFPTSSHRSLGTDAVVGFRTGATVISMGHVPFSTARARDQRSLQQRFVTTVLQEVLTHAIPDHLVSSTDLSSLRLPNKKVTAANTIAVQCE